MPSGLCGRADTTLGHQLATRPAQPGKGDHRLRPRRFPCEREKSSLSSRAELTSIESQPN